MSQIKASVRLKVLIKDLAGGLFYLPDSICSLNRVGSLPAPTNTARPPHLLSGLKTFRGFADGRHKQEIYDEETTFLTLPQKPTRPSRLGAERNISWKCATVDVWFVVSSCFEQKRLGGKQNSNKNHTALRVRLRLTEKCKTSKTSFLFLNAGRKAAFFYEDEFSCRFYCQCQCDLTK